MTSVVGVLDYTDTTAAHHARLIAYARRVGVPSGAHDLIIAAHAVETGRPYSAVTPRHASPISPQ
jgi:tRNA(fMet)-specific endonuclease VapC